MGEFEDDWEDEIESDEEAVDGQNDNGACTSNFPELTFLSAAAT